MTRRPWLTGMRRLLIQLRQEGQSFAECARIIAYVYARPVSRGAVAYQVFQLRREALL